MQVKFEVSEMSLTSRELFQKALRGETTPRPPFWFMRQAGRYLPEYMELRRGKTFEDLLMNPDLAAEITVQPIRRFDMDAAIIFSDILTPLYAMNRGLKIVPQKGPVIENPIRTEADVASLTKTRPEEDYPYLAESLRLVRKELPHHALIGFSGAPFTLASYLIEGASTRDALFTKAFALQHPEAFSNLMSLLTEVVMEQLRSEIKQEVDAVQVFDSWAGFLSPSQYEQWVKPVMQRIFEHSDFHGFPLIYYARGMAHLLPVVADLPCTFFSIDHTISLGNARRIVGESKGLQGNLDPSYLLGSKKSIEAEAMKILGEGSKHPRYIFNLSTGINKHASVDNVAFLVNVIKRFTRDDQA